MQAAIRSKQEERRKNFKKGLDPSESRRRREEETAKIRKNKREELVLKRRNMGAFDPQSAVVKTSEDLFLDSSDSNGQIGFFIQQIYSSDPEQVLIGTRSIRKVLSRESSPPIEEVIASGIIPRLVELIKLNEAHEIQFEAAWALTNIASGTPDQTQVVISNGAVPAFVEMTVSAIKEENKEQATWALGNIAGDSPQCRDYVISCNALPPLFQNLLTSSSKSFLRNATWTLSNLVRGKPSPNFSLVSPALKPLYRLLHLQDEEILSDACWALSYMTDGEDYRIQGVIDAGIVPRLAQLLRHSNVSVVTPALRTIGNIVTGNKSQTQTAIDVGALADVYQLLVSSSSRNLTKECCWTLSNITAGTHKQIQAVFDAEFLPVILPLFSEGEFEIKKELAWTITNAISGGTNQQIIYLVEQGFLKPLSELLITHDSSLSLICLEAVDKILSVGETLLSPKTNHVNPYTIALEKIGGVDILEDLQNHSNRRIHELAEKILDEYFEGEEEENMFDTNNSSTQHDNNNNNNNQIVPLQQQSAFTFGGDRFNMSGNFVF